MAPHTPPVLLDPLTNRGTAFTAAERARHGLVGRLPDAVLTLEQQAVRAYEQLRREPTPQAKFLNLEHLHDRNEVLYYRLLRDHLPELLPIVYDPTIAEAVKQYSHDYRWPRGVFLSLDRPGDVRRSFESLELGPDGVDLVVVTDAQQILGIGDWGVQGIQISVGKLAVYTAAAGIDPARCIPVVLDVGTDNEELLADPLYLGARHRRVRGRRYDDFVRSFVETVTELYPHALLHFEDFGPDDARRLLETYAGRHRVFNDDMQGTGAITLAAVASALSVTGAPFREQRVVVFGAGTAGVGIADQLRDAMVQDGLSRADATRRIWLIDRPGLLLQGAPELRDYQSPYARDPAELHGRQDGGDPSAPPGLLETVRSVHPTVLIGTSTVPGAFDREVVTEMAAHTERPVILPLSNPTERAEAVPADLLAWTDGRALTATGVPTDPVDHGGVRHVIGQANNALLYPGLGLGTVVAGAERVTAAMLSAAARAVSDQVDARPRGAPLLPAVADLLGSSVTVATAVVRAAVDEGVATRRPDAPEQAVREAVWEPRYGEPESG